MRLKHSFISILIIFLTGNSAAQFGSELGGDTLQESFVNFMQAITLVDIGSVAAAFLFLAVVALFYYASLNIFEQVFLRLEEIIKEALGDDARSIYRDNDHYPTGVKGMALAVGFISANGVTGLIGLFAGIAIGLISVFIPLVVQSKMMRILGDTRIDEDGNLTRERRDYSRNGRRRTPNPSGGDVNINGDPTMDPQEVVDIIHIIESAEEEIQEVERIEEEEYKEAERAKDKLEEKISSMEEQLEENVTEKIKEILRYKNKSDSNIAKYLEDPDGNKHELRRINFSSSSDRQEKRDLSGKVSRNIDNLESKAIGLEEKISNNDFGADYEALNKLEKIKHENHEIFEDYKTAIQHIKQRASVSDDISQILKEVTKPKNLKYAGYANMEDRKQIDEMVKDFKEQKEKMESIEGSVDKVNKILNDEDLPELDAIRKKTESRKKLVGYLLNEDEESNLSRDHIRQIKSILEYYESHIEKAEDIEKSHLQEIYSHHQDVHAKAEEIEETIKNDINPDLEKIFNTHNVTPAVLQDYLKDPSVLSQDIKDGNISFSTESSILTAEDNLLQRVKDLQEAARDDKELDERDYEETREILKENHSVIQSIKNLKEDVQRATGDKDFDKTIKQFTKKENWSAAGLDYDKNAKKLAEILLDAEEKVQEIEELAENLEKAEKEEFEKIEKIEKQLESRKEVLELIEGADKSGGGGKGKAKGASKGPGSEPWIVSLSDIESKFEFMAKSLMLPQNLGSNSFGPMVELDSEGDLTWVGGNKFILVINGDLVQSSRGSSSQKVWDNIAKLIEEAPDGHVRLTLGNHDVGFVMKNYPVNESGAVSNPGLYMSWLNEGIVAMAWKFYNYTYVHAGQNHSFDIKTANDLLGEIAGKSNQDLGIMNYQREFQNKSISNTPFSNLSREEKILKLVGVGNENTGNHKDAGMIWLRPDKISDNAPKQVVGHTGQNKPTRKGNLILQNTAARSGYPSIVVETPSSIFGIYDDGSGPKKVNF